MYGYHEMAGEAISSRLQEAVLEQCLECHWHSQNLLRPLLGGDITL